MEGKLEVFFSLDGDKWCARIGENLQDGYAGFGNSPAEALRELADEIEVHMWNIPGVTLF